MRRESERTFHSADSDRGVLGPSWNGACNALGALAVVELLSDVCRLNAMSVVPGGTFAKEVRAAECEIVDHESAV
jgi:hypothetical protein